VTNRSIAQTRPTAEVVRSVLYGSWLHCPGLDCT
jgi:hypothetical protein